MGLVGCCLFSGNPWSLLALAREREKATKRGQRIGVCLDA